MPTTALPTTAVPTVGPTPTTTTVPTILPTTDVPTLKPTVLPTRPPCTLDLTVMLPPTQLLNTQPNLPFSVVPQVGVNALCVQATYKFTYTWTITAIEAPWSALDVPAIAAAVNGSHPVFSLPPYAYARPPARPSVYMHRTYVSAHSLCAPRGSPPGADCRRASTASW